MLCFVKLTSRWSTVSRWWATTLTTDYKRNWNTGVFTHKSWKKDMTCLGEPHVVVKEEYWQWDWTWDAFLGPMGGALEGSWAKAEWVNSYPKSKVLVSRTRVLPKWCTKHINPRRQGITLITKAADGSYQDINMSLTVRLLSRVCTCTSGLMSVWVLQATDQAKWILRQQCHVVTLLNFQHTRISRQFYKNS